jgi:hypothetical protein
VKEMYKVLLVSVILSIIGGPSLGYLIAVSKEPIHKEIDIPDSATRSFVMGEGLDGIAYRSTGPIFSHFVHSCEPSPVSYATDFSPSCIYLGFNGKPGVAELDIPRYIIHEFPIIDEVYYDGPLTLDERIQFEIVKQDNSSTTIRVQVPPDHNGITISGSDEGSISPFHKYLLGWGLIMTVSVFFACVILNVVIGNKLRVISHKMKQLSRKYL